MTEAILDSLAAAITVAGVIVMIHVLRRRSVPATDGNPPSPADRTSHPLGGSGEFIPLADPSLWRSRIVTDLSAVEELLDGLEAEGYEVREVIVLGPATFLVRWRGHA